MVAAEPLSKMNTNLADTDSVRISKTAGALASKSRDFAALRDAVVDAAGVSTGLWLSYLFMLFYLLIAVGSVTHRDLFFENPVKLPFLNVDLPLLGFFAIGPGLFLVVHAYVLLNFVLLAGKIRAFDAGLQGQTSDKDVRARLRGQLPNNIFVQLLAGPRDVRTGLVGVMLRLIAQISLVLGPIALLVFFQLQFLPYHSVVITWWHRLAVVADLALLWMLWPLIAQREAKKLVWQRMLRLTVGTFAVVLLVFTIATFPGEFLEEALPAVRFIPQGGYWNESWRLVSLHELLVAGDVDLPARKPLSLWSNRIVLPGLDVVDHTKIDEGALAALPETMSLRARHLEGAILIGANLRKVDFTAAKLAGADFTNADLRGARFECAEGDRNEANCAQLQGASFERAHLQGASFESAQLQGASFMDAHLQGAWFQLARLEGASFQSADLRGARFKWAYLQAASFKRASLEAALLDGAHIQGGLFDDALLQGASLEYVQLQGASFDNAQLQGASFIGAQLQSASFREVLAWRATLPVGALKDVRAVTVRTNRCEGRAKVQGYCEWTTAAFNDLLAEIKEKVPTGNTRPDEGYIGDMQGNAIARIQPELDPMNVSLPDEMIAKTWADLERSYIRETYEKSLADQWREIGCTVDGAPYVLDRLVDRMQDANSSPFSAQGSEKSELAAAFLDVEHCPASLYLSGATTARLKEIRDRPPPSPIALSAKDPKF
ncbi:pentapeptide repeat-containing protein [Mesorhizobium australicum]|uniref:pentapeptide repeat-containing protein n=1 Tax=Mesorhizobium australicum TaxID=536018 RepID=UPI003337104F